MKRTLFTLSAGVLALGLTTAAFADDTPAAAATPPAMAKTEAPAKHHEMHHHAAAKMHVDLNAATKEDLMKLPGIDDATADKIIAARPFKTRGELASKSILTKEQYSKIRGWVMVKK